MAADVLGERLHGDVDAVGEGVEVDTGRPGVIHDNHCSGAMSGVGDCGDILDFKSDRTGTFTPHHAGIFANQSLNGGTGFGRIETNFDAEAAEDLNGEFAIRRVDAFGDEDVISGCEEREIDERDGALAAGSDEGAEAALQFADAGGEFEGGGRSIESVGIADLILVPVIIDRRGIGKQDGGGALDTYR